MCEDSLRRAWRGVGGGVVGKQGVSSKGRRSCVLCWQQ